MKRFWTSFLVFVTISLSTSLQAQESTKLNFDLRHYLESCSPNQAVPLLVEGTPTVVEQYVESNGGKIRLALPPLYSIELPAAEVLAFSKLEEVKQIDFSLSPGQALSDTMLVQTRAEKVHQIVSPLREKYTGKGVLVGIIDSGIELDHGDFQDSLGNTRVLHVWDQGVPYNPTYQAGNYTYGVEWDAVEIDNGISTHDDKASEFGHGSNVSGAAVSNGLATGNFKGVAPEAGIISVATDFNKPNWLQTMVEATDYIFKKADTLNMPVVINASVGTYLGSHDGKDIAARMIDQLIKQKNGRAFVCAAGNAGTFNFHLQHQPNQDTLFSWFESHPQMFSGLGGVYFELWSDTSDFNQMQFAIGADRIYPVNQFEFRGRTAFATAQNRLNQTYLDSIISVDGNLLAYVSTFVTESQGRYKMEVAIVNPDSNQYRFRFESTGNGKVDIWSSFSLFRHSNIIGDNLPSLNQFPAMQHYQKPDSLQSMVSSFSCLPSVITVGNYVNRSTYVDVSGTPRQFNVTPGEISINSSLGPNREGYLKPDISSAGDYMFSAGRLATINQAIQSNPAKVSQDSLHFRNGGTSMASPTVAGMLALLFEKCSNLSYSDVKGKLISTARTDAFTQNLPNPKWGYGKADAYQLISNEIFVPSLTLNSVSICEGDSVTLNTTQPFAQYFWNTGDTTANISLDSSGTYFATVSNSANCRDRTDSLMLRVDTLPFKPSINQQNDTLYTDGSAQLQWYYNQFAIPSANQSKLAITQNGNYYVKSTNSSNCSTNSDTLTVISVGLDENRFYSVQLYPNPTAAILHVNLTEPLKNLELKVYDLSGKALKVPVINESSNSLRLNLSEIKSGPYLLQIKSSSQTKFFKIYKL
ncbi:MAG: S8 family serine peptidase [Vicingaceae bacterium]